MGERVGLLPTFSFLVALASKDLVELRSTGQPGAFPEPVDGAAVPTST